MSPSSAALSLFYRSSAGRAQTTAWPDRGTGPAIVLHAGEPGALPDLITLAHWITARHPEAQVLCTTRQAGRMELVTKRLPATCRYVAPVSDEVKFHATLRPDVWIWSDDTPPRERLGDALVIRLNTPKPASGGFFRRSGSVRSYTRFDHLMCPSRDTLDALVRVGAAPSKLHVGGRLGYSIPPDLHDPEHEALLRRQIRDRPVWHAADISRDELRFVIEAHRTASRSIHRLLLLVTGSDLDRSPPDRSAIWSASPDAPAIREDVLIGRSKSDAALFYRTAPVSFVGQSTGAARGASPLQAIALGSAVLHGPSVADYADLYRALDQENAAIEVTTPAKLSEALSRTLTPDRTAELAHNGWRVTSEGAETLDQVLSLIADHLHREAA